MIKVGDIIYVRSSSSGVWRGRLKNWGSDYSWVILSEAEHLYQWQTVEGVTMAALAANGLDRENSIISPTVELTIIRDIAEIIPECLR